MRIGRVIQSVGGFHTVRFQDGDELLLKARGKVKRKGAILVGDRVEVRIADEGGVVEHVQPRTSQLVRPAIANVELVVVVVSIADPPPSYDLLDRILAHAEREGLAALVVFNKFDLADEDQLTVAAEPYTCAGYRVLRVSAMAGLGIDELAGEIAGRVAVVAGPSGVGKTSILRALSRDTTLETGAVSERTSRGRHTTRAVRLLPLPSGGWIADSPGFSTLTFGIVDPRTVRDWYPEFRALEAECRFSGCLHRAEPGCAVRGDVDAGRVDRGRYERYLRLLAEIEEAYERRY